MYTAIIGFAMLAIFIGLLMKGRAAPAIIFVLLPIAAALVAGYSVEDINTYVKAGMNSVLSNAVLFCFAILFFTIMSDAGLFTPLIQFVMRTAGKSLGGLCAAAALIALAGHLDGSATTTIFVTLPFFLPIFEKRRIDKRVLILIIGSTMGVMNMMPWAGTLLRVSSSTGIAVDVIWHHLLPIQAAGLITALILGIVMGKTLPPALPTSEAGKSALSEELKPVTIDGRFWFNLILTLSTVATLMLTDNTPYLVFMMASALALVVNRRDQKAQQELIGRAAKPAFFVVITMLAAGVFIGILDGGENSMLLQMSTLLINVLPTSLLRYLHLILAVITVPLGLLLSGDTYMYGVLPLCIQLGEPFGIGAEAMGIICAIGDSISIIGSPVYPATYLILSLANVELKDYLKFALLPMWGISMVMVLTGILFGYIPV